VQERANENSEFYFFIKSFISMNYLRVSRDSFNSPAANFDALNQTQACPKHTADDAESVKQCLGMAMMWSTPCYWA
jgi:hypothetical protein